MNLFLASNQWASRPDDERFDTLEDLHRAVHRYRESAVTATVPFNSLRVQADGGEVLLVGRENTPARFTHWSFGQLATSIGAPASYLRDLPATLAAQNLNYGLARTTDRTDRRLLFHRNGSMLTRAITSKDRYTRVWNNDITQRLLRLPADGWQVPPARPVRAQQAGTRPATEADVLRGAKFGLSVHVGDLIAPAGLYASDHDMFVFMVQNDVRISEPGNPDGLARGFFLLNSEVGASALWLIRFLYRHTCGNHIVWGAKQVERLRIPHIGDADERAFRQIEVELTKYADDSASDDEARIQRAASFVLGATKDEVLDRLFAIKNLGVSRQKLDAAYDTCEQEEPSSVNPRSAWGMAQGLTRLSQETPFADERTTMDYAAGKIMEIAF